MIRLEDIHKAFGDVQVLRGVSVQFAPGRLTAVVGASGAGKTTLLQVLGTLERPDRGRVLYDGTDVANMPDARLSAFRNANIGFVFQQHRLLPEFTLAENVALPAMIAGQSHKKAMAAANALLQSMDLAGRAKHRPAQLSGGEAQRGAVARALINNPAVVLADEPSGSLDSQNRNMLYDLFFDLRDRLGTTFVVVTHDEALAARADTAVRLSDGRLSG